MSLFSVSLLGITALSSLLLGPSLVKLAKQIRDREEHLDDDGVIMVHLFVIGASWSVALGLGCNLILFLVLAVTSVLAPSNALKLIEAVRDRKEPSKVRMGILCAFCICWGFMIAIGVWTHISAWPSWP